ncbi:unnamed protein product [Caenorhabditis angaria]|uniref:Calponin-homology (CH) domain-containing protein n=1 Tax=Caenorhabditis angaria TaxID=860376 RepID=A0A9P1N0C4_9PELO|nr:unnamed protein product [Caenorhabditis angaria]
MKPRSMDEKRERNLSLGCVPRQPLPGFSAYLGSITKCPKGRTTFLPFGNSRPLDPQECVGVFTSMYCNEVNSEYSFQPMFSLSDTPPLVSPEQTDDESPTMIRKKESSSSGYGSCCSEVSIPSIIGVPLKPQRYYKVPRIRRLSMPPSYFENEVTRAVDDEFANYETDVDTGLQIRTEIRGMSRPESVIQLARKFAEISAAQQKDLHKSRTQLATPGKENSMYQISKSGPSTPSRQTAPTNIGGIASLRASGGEAKMSRPNMFKQMEKVGSGNSTSSIAPRQLNPNSIKDALLRWIQNRVAGYPNVNVTNFSSSWADGMAFCALIHRFAPHSFDFAQLDPQNRRYNFELAFKTAEDNGIYPLLEVDDMIMMGDRPDWKCVFTYVQAFYKQFRDHP